MGGPFGLQWRSKTVKKEPQIERVGQEGQKEGSRGDLGVVWGSFLRSFLMFFLKSSGYYCWCVAHPFRRFLGRALVRISAEFVILSQHVEELSIDGVMRLGHDRKVS